MKVVALLLALICPVALAQAAPAPPAFDVATIKPHPAEVEPEWIGLRNTSDGIEGQSVTISVLVQRAYGLRSTDQVSGGPDWAKTERFDIQAKMSGAETAEMEKLSPTEIKTRRGTMLQALLDERFHLKIHAETKQAAVYQLVVAKGGAKLKDSAIDTRSQLEKATDGTPLIGFNQSTATTMVAQGQPTAALADFLSRPISGLGRLVVDKTGLTGTYNFTLNWVPHWDRVVPASATGPVSPEEADSLFEALQQIGLKLQAATGPVETIVIDHVERPSEN